jgi:hypothetical protein
MKSLEESIAIAMDCAQDIQNQAFEYDVSENKVGGSIMALKRNANLTRIKSRLAPCGLHCGKCFAFTDGEINRLSKELKNALGSFDAYASRFVSMLDEPIFLKYPAFEEMLEFFAKGKCGGCRKEKCVIFKTCKVKECSEKKGVDFCFECREFPCNDTGFDENLQKRWQTINNKMKEVGVETYYHEIKDKPRY